MARYQMRVEEDHIGRPQWSYMIPDYVEIPGYAYGDWLLILDMENSRQNCLRLWGCMKKKLKKLVQKVQKKVADEWEELQYQRIIVTNTVIQKAYEVKDRVQTRLDEIRHPGYQRLY